MSKINVYVKMKRHSQLIFKIQIWNREHHLLRTPRFKINIIKISKNPLKLHSQIQLEKILILWQRNLSLQMLLAMQESQVFCQIKRIAVMDK